MSNSRGSDAYKDDAVTAQWQQRRHQYRASTRSKQGDFEGFSCLSGLWMKYLGLWMTLVLQERSDVGIYEGLPFINDSHKLSTSIYLLNTIRLVAIFSTLKSRKTRFLIFLACPRKIVHTLHTYDTRLSNICARFDFRHLNSHIPLFVTSYFYLIIPILSINLWTMLPRMN